MTQSPTGNVVEVKPAPTVYTVLILIALLALVAAIVVAGHRLTADSANHEGYGLTVSDILKPWDTIQPQVDSSQAVRTRNPRRPSR